MARLTEKQKRFVAEYLVDLNATQAAIRAGYKAKSAYSIGQENLKKPEIQSALRKAMKRRSERTELTQDMVLRELAAVGFANGTDFAEVRGGRVVFRDTAAVDSAKYPAVAGIKEGRDGVEVRLYDKIRALELIGRHLGMFEGKSGRQAEGEAREAWIAAVTGGEEGEGDNGEGGAG